MTELPATELLETHDVTNQPDAAGDRDLWADDIVLRMLAGNDGKESALATYGATLGRRDMRTAARNAERHAPELRLFDHAGRRLDEVVYHPDYHRFMATSIAAGYHSAAWERDAGGHVVHAAMVYLASQVEPGHCCPLTMTYAAQPVIGAAEGLRDDWRALALAREYDPAAKPAKAKPGVTLGMAMTEKQGGSDVRANSTVAERDGDAWRLTGHKWFCSAPMSDGFLTLARTGSGLTCFLVPRWLDDERNGIRIQRLKEKLGNRSNASAEIEYHRALAYRVGGDGEGVRTIVEMVHHTRLDTAIAPAGLMRAALREAHHWVSNRLAFQKRLIDQPLMRTVLADLALDWQGALTLGMHVARCFDGRTPEDRAFARIGVALAKFLNNKLCPTVVGEAMEVLGGMGYVEETMLPKLFREAPLNGIWEGSGNVICLDVLRTLAKVPLAADALNADLDSAAGMDKTYDAALAEYRARWQPPVAEAEARWFAERTALLLTASALLRHGEPKVAEAFVDSRLSGNRGRTSGALAPMHTNAVLAHGLEPA